MCLLSELAASTLLSFVMCRTSETKRYANDYICICIWSIVEVAEWRRTCVLSKWEQYVLTFQVFLCLWKELNHGKFYRPSVMIQYHPMSSKYEGYGGNFYYWKRSWLTVPQTFSSPWNIVATHRTTSASIVRISGKTSAWSGLDSPNSSKT